MTDSKFYPVAHHWGRGLAEVRGGELVGVRAPHDDPDPSPINGNIAEAVRGRARIGRPHVRKSFLEKGAAAGGEGRGGEAFVPVSWERALDLAAREIDRVRRTHGNKAIFGGSYGWASAGRFHHAQSQVHRFLNCIGGYVRSQGNYSYHAALVLMPHIVGSYARHTREYTPWPVIERSGELVVMFGGVPRRNAQVGAGGLGKHRLFEEMLACCRAGVEFVSVSPYRGDAARELEAKWLAPRPGSDTALMLGIAHTLLSEGLHDEDFLARYCVGFDRFKDYLLGGPDGEAKDADWAAERSEIPAEAIRALARRMAEKRTLLLCTASLQRAEHGEQPIWMTVVLASMLGQIGLPGGGYGVGYGADGNIGITAPGPGYPSLPQGENPVADFIPVAAIADMLLKPGEPFQFNGQDLSYPEIQLVYWAGGNPFHHHQDLNRLVEAWKRPEVVIVNEISWTATARHADIVFPVTSALERSDIGANSAESYLLAMPQVIPPVGESRNDYEVFSGLAERLGAGEAFTEGRSEREWLELFWSQARQRAARVDVELPSLEEFWSDGSIELPERTADRVFLSAFRRDPEANPLPTPSGRIEIFSETIASFDYDDCPGHPTWLPPRDWQGAETAARFPLHLLSGQPEARLHSQFDNGAYSRKSKIKDREPVLINPEDAAARGISDGEIVRLFNERGACLAGARVTEEVRRGVVFLNTGAWYDPLEPGRSGSLEKHGNPNVLTHDRRTSRLSQGPAAHSTLIEVERYEGEPPPVTAFEPPVQLTPSG